MVIDKLGKSIGQPKRGTAAVSGGLQKKTAPDHQEINPELLSAELTEVDQLDSAEATEKEEDGTESNTKARSSTGRSSANTGTAIRSKRGDSDTGTGKGAFADSAEAITISQEVEMDRPEIASGRGASMAPVSQMGPASSYVSLMESVKRLLVVGPTLGDKSAQMVVICRLQEKTRKLQTESGLKSIQAKFEESNTGILQRKRKQEEAAAKLEEARKKMENASIWDKILGAFQALASLLSIALGGVMVATGVGSVLGSLMIAGGIVGLVCSIDTIVKLTSENNLGIAGNIAVLSGQSVEQAREHDKKFGYAMMAITLALAVATIAVGVHQFISKAVETAVKVSYRLLIRTLKIASAVAQVGAGTTMIGSGVLKGEAGMVRGDAMELKAEDQVLAAGEQELRAQVDRIIGDLRKVAEAGNEALDRVMDALIAENEALLRVKI